MAKQSNKEDFISKARAIHGDKYDYSLVQYKNCKTNVKIICPIHGVFEQTPDKHINAKQGCPVCSGNMKKTTEQFITEAKQVHGDKYDYSKVNYINRETNVTIICPEHGEFEQLPSNHLKGEGCPYCTGKMTTEMFISDAIKVHGNKYDYSKTDLNVRDENGRVCIICPEHGEFWQYTHVHKKGCGCPYCAGNAKKTKEQFIEDSRKVHGEKYSYEKFIYEGNHKKGIITCPIHGDFVMTPNKHIISKQGCPYCNESQLEEKTALFLTENNISFERRKHFDWLGKKHLDFYLPKYNVAIECQGEQHFKSVEFFGDKIGFKDTVNRDIDKNNLCTENNVGIIYYTDSASLKYSSFQPFYENNLFSDLSVIMAIIEKKGTLHSVP